MEIADDFAVNIEQVPHIIFLPGVFLEKKTEEKTFQKVCVNKFLTENKIQFDKIPSYYYSQNTWPNTTNLLCWCCGCKFTTQPYFAGIGTMKISVPRENKEKGFLSFIKSENINKSKNLTEIKVIIPHGNYCSLPCLGYGIYHYVENKWLARELTKKVYLEWTGNELLDIPIAESPYCMKKFTGPNGISENKYHEINRKKLELCIKKI